MNPSNVVNNSGVLTNSPSQVRALASSPSSQGRPMSNSPSQLRTMNFIDQNQARQLPQQIMSMGGNTVNTQGGQMMGISQPPLGIRPNVPVQAQPALGMRPNLPAQVSAPAMQSENKVLDKRRLQELVKEIDPLEQLDDDVEEVLLQIADDFIESVVTSSCLIAKHRRSNTLEVKDVQLHLERSWDMWVPGFGSEELRPYKKAPVTEAHKQRMALIKKTLKKY